jgi:hypothetical protein
MNRAGLLILACLGAGTAAAQFNAATFFNPLSASRDGIHLYNLSVYGGYFSGGIPFEVSTGNPFLNSGNSAVAGGSANLGWSRTREGSSLSISESLSFMAYPEHVVQPNTKLTLNWSRKIGRKWSISTAGTAQLVNLQQTYFTANALGAAASLPTTFDGLSAAMLRGTFTDAQLASALTGASASLLPEQAYLYGQQVGSASAMIGLSYAPSGRSSVHVNFMATRTQTLNFEGSTQNTPGLIPHTTSGNVSVGWGYSLTPRTQIGLDGESTRIFSRVQDGYMSSAGFSIGRTMTEHWFVQGRIGAGMLTYLRQTAAPPRNVQYTAGGSMGYKLRSHTLLGSFNRMIGDSYGLGAGSTNAATAGWTWRAPGSSWSVSASYNYQQLNGSALLTNESWRATGGIARALSSHLFITVQYAYFKLPPTFLQANGSLDTQSGVTMSLSWSPSQYR